MITKEKVEEIQKELDNFDLNDALIQEAVDHNESANMNELVEKIAMAVTHMGIILAVVTTGGTWGKVAGTAYLISKLAGLLKLYSNHRANKKIKEEYKRFLTQLKEKGIYDGKED